MRAAGRLSRDRVIDAAVVALALVLLVDREFVGVGVPRDIAGSSAWTFPLFLAVPTALAVRRSHPLLTLVAVSTAPAVHALVAGQGAEGAFLLLPLCVALYSVGAYGSARRIVVGLVVATASVTIATLQDSHALHTAAERWSLAFWLCAEVVIAVVGFYVASRRRERRAVRAHQDAEVRTAAATQEAIATERARIARELHDVVTHNLNVVVLHAQAAQPVTSEQPERVRRSLEAIEHSGRGALAEMRRLLGMLREDTDRAPLDPQPGLAAVAALAEQAASAGVDVQIDGELTAAVGDGVGLTAYRIVQEALSNAMRHAPGAPVRIRIAADALALRVEVRNGSRPGAAPGVPAGAGHGLIGMRERVAVFGGQLDAGPAADGGYRVAAALPVEDPS